MEMTAIYKKIFQLMFLTFLLLSSFDLDAQHRGDNLSFQGLMESKNFSVRSTAMGGAFTTMSGDLSSLFTNPAGLSKIKQLQVSIAANNYAKQWGENQDYRPDRYFVTLPFYLEGLYIPDPANNGKWDYQLAQDTNYNYLVKEPKLGLDAYSEEAADWIERKNKFGLTSLAAAFPFSMAEKNFVAAVAFNIDNNFYDFDRNDTYLDPHIGYFYYGGDISRVDGIKTMNMKWSRFLRERIGTLNNITGGLSVEMTEDLYLGVGFNFMWGESDDRLSISRVGDFLLSNQQRFMFSYVNAIYKESGTSKYSSANINLGLIYEFNRFKVGIRTILPYTITREWNYVRYTQESTTETKSINGKDKFKVPAIFSFGFGFNPIEKFIIAFDYEYAPFSKAKYEFQQEDPTFRKWADRNIIKFGFEYQAFNFLSFLGGYQSIPQVFIPDGSAYNNKGPEASSYNFGISLNLFLGRIDIAYELRLLKYYDSYFSNTNYAFEKSNNLMIGYTFFLK